MRRSGVIPKASLSRCGLLEGEPGSRRIARGDAAGGQGSCSRGWPRASRPTGRARCSLEIRETALVLTEFQLWLRPSSRARSHELRRARAIRRAQARSPIRSPPRQRPRVAGSARPRLQQGRCLGRRRLERVDESVRAFEVRSRARALHGPSSRRREAPPPRPPPRDRSLARRASRAASMPLSPRASATTATGRVTSRSSSAPGSSAGIRSSARS